MKNPIVTKRRYFVYTRPAKGEKAYKQHKLLFTAKAKNISKLSDCTEMIYEWLTFFRTGHIGIRLLDQQNNQSGDKKSDEEISKSYEDWGMLLIHLVGSSI